MHATRKKKENRRTAQNMERQATLVAVHTRWHDDLQLLCCYCSYCAVESKGKVNMLLKALRRQKWIFFLSSALTCVGFSTGQPRIHQGNQIHGFGCPAFEIGTTFFFFNFEHCSAA